MADSGPAETVLRLTAQIVAAHVEHNSVQPEALPGLIEKVYQTLRDVGQAPVAPEKPTPAVPIKQSIKPDFIICLYPMVAPNYAKVRSSLAKKIGLGRKAAARPARQAAKRRATQSSPRGIPTRT
jgi:predicted transcriptional regulator